MDSNANDGKIHRTTTTTVQVTVPSFSQTAPGTPAVSVTVTSTSPEITDTPATTPPNIPIEKEDTGIQSTQLSELTCTTIPPQPAKDDTAETDTENPTALPPGHDDVRGRPISRRGCSIFDIFQQIHGPGYSREEMDDALRIPSIRNFLFDELRRQNNALQQICQPEEAEDLDTADPPMPELERVPTPPPAPRTETICYYHREFGTRARRCRPPCLFNRSCYYCGLRGSPGHNSRTPCSHNQRM